MDLGKAFRHHPLWVTSHLQRPKKSIFFFIWKKLNSNFKPNVSIKKKCLKSLKAPELFRKTYFQIKVNTSGRCRNLGPGRVPWENFRGNRSCWGSIFMLFSYFVYIAHFTKFTRKSSLFMEKSNAEESRWGKKRKKNRLKLRKIGYHCQIKKKFLCENDLY